MPLAEIQPSQLYISLEKLAQVQAWWQPPRLETLTPVPIKQLNGRIIYTDGHTRAFAAYWQGLAEIPVFWDTDELDWEAYQICVEWCLEAQIHTVMDLEGRLLSPSAYERLWRDRCRAMQTTLTQ
ncbi:MAG: hypothetical protein JXA33_22395 [Anaerolineae bacterium]|nr:hypothetical protein [Anaerolineae bacterium]